MTIQAEVEWIDKFQFEGRTGDGPAVAPDASDDQSGTSPMQRLLLGIADCIAMDVMTALRNQRQDIKGFKVNISAKRAEDHPRRFSDVHITYIIQGSDVDEKIVKKAIELSEDRHCNAMVSLDANIAHTYRIDPPVTGKGSS